MEQGECTTAKVGQKIRDFSFSTYNPCEGAFEDHSFKEFLQQEKWLVLVFYPADFTFVCPTELADVAEQHAALQKTGAEVLSFSTDSKFAHLAWRNSEKMLERVRFQMASDPTGEITRYFGIYDAEGGTALRGTFIINPEGVLVGSEINFYNVGRNAEELVRKMQANAYLATNPAEACPARWQSGDKTLTPSEKIVGNVYEEMQKK